MTDGLLALRYLFGFTGNALITGAVGSVCTRCTAEEIAEYLDSLMPNRLIGEQDIGVFCREE